MEVEEVWKISHPQSDSVEGLMEITTDMVWTMAKSTTIYDIVAYFKKP